MDSPDTKPNDLPSDPPPQPRRHNQKKTMDEWRRYRSDSLKELAIERQKQTDLIKLKEQRKLEIDELTMQIKEGWKLIAMHTSRVYRADEALSKHDLQQSAQDSARS